MEKWNINEMEEQILLLLDNELKAEQAAKVWMQIEAYPEYKELYEAYAAAYLEADEMENKIDFSYLQQPESESIAAPMTKRKSLKSVWGIAAGLAIVATIGTFFWNEKRGGETIFEQTVTKSDKSNTFSQSPIQQLAEDSLKNKQKQIIKVEPTKLRQQAIKTNSEARLAITPMEQNEMPKVEIETDLAAAIKTTLQPIAFEAPKHDAIAFAAVKMPQEKEMERDEAKGLFPEMYKAGQWIFGERKQSTTVEIAIGNNENRTFKLKF